RRILAASEDRAAAATLRAAHPAVAARLLASLSAATAARILGFLPTDARVAIMAALGADAHARIDEALAPADREEIDRLLSYGESAVGRLMTPKIWRAGRTATAGEALAALRDRAAEIEVAQNCYVVDEAGKLVGVVPLRELAIAPPETPLEKVMTRDPIAVREDAERGDA